VTQLSTPVFISVDIETTGPTAYNGEICSIGAVAVYDDGTISPSEEAFSVNLEWRDGAMLHRFDPNTIEWWRQWPKQWEAHRHNPVPPLQAMEAFDSWAVAITKKPIFVAWPVAFDWGMVNYYNWQYLNRNSFGYSPVCLKNFALGKLNKPKALLGNREEAEMPDSWLITPEDLGLTSHIALDDAVAQAHMLKAILNDPLTEGDST